MIRYKVEFISSDKKSKFSTSCNKEELNHWKNLCKEICNDGICFYRKYPLTRAKKIYF